MKTCPACKKDSDNDTECIHCGIFFAKWEAIHPSAAPAQGNQPALSDQSVDISFPPPVAVKSTPWAARIMLAVAVAGVGLWFFQRGAGEKKVRATYQEFRKAIASADLTKTKSLVSKEYAKEFEDEQAELKLKFVSGMSPAQAEITAVEVESDSATVKAKGTVRNFKMQGTTQFVKEGGLWKVSKEGWEILEMIQSTGTPSGPSDPADLSQAMPAMMEAMMGAMSGVGQPQSADGFGSAMQPVSQTEDSPAPVTPVSPAQYQQPRDPYFEKYGKASVPELLSALRTDSFNREQILRDLTARGERGSAATVLNQLLRQKDPETTAQAKMLLRRVGEPVTFDWDKNVSPVREDDMSLIEWEIEILGNSLFSTGRVFVGREVVDGFSRRQATVPAVATFARYHFQIVGGSVSSPIEKTVAAETRAGEQVWTNMALASGLGPGVYRVTIAVQAQTVAPDGSLRIINHSASSLQVELK